MKLILVSKSKGRRQVLTEAGFEFEIYPAEIDEKGIRSDDAEQLTLLLAQAKAAKLLKEIKEPALLITSDQVVLCNGEIREKPETKKQAYDFLKSYSSNTASAITAVVVANTVTGEQSSFVDVATVSFGEIPEENIVQLVENGQVMHAAGGFIVQDPLMEPYVTITESTLDSVIGLPLEKTKELINKHR